MEEGQAPDPSRSEKPAAAADPPAGPSRWVIFALVFSGAALILSTWQFNRGMDWLVRDLEDGSGPSSGADDAAPGPVGRIELRNLNSQGVEFWWTSTEPLPTRLRLKGNRGARIISGPFPRPQTTHVVRVSDLEPGAWYEARVCLPDATGAGCEPTGRPVQFGTPALNEEPVYPPGPEGP